jgi:chromosome segregation ATPase
VEGASATTPCPAHDKPTDVDGLPQTKFMSLQTTHNTTTTSLQRELDMLRQEQQNTKVQLRDLEMGNDDLERNERAIASSLADVESKYSRALEEKILLEHELLDKANLEEECQRLKDELRGVSEASAKAPASMLTHTRISSHNHRCQ